MTDQKLAQADVLFDAQVPTSTYSKIQCQTLFYTGAVGMATGTQAGIGAGAAGAARGVEELARTVRNRSRRDGRRNASTQTE